SNASQTLATEGPGNTPGPPFRILLVRHRPLPRVEPPIVPGDTPVDAVGDVLRLAQAVSLARIAHHQRLHADVPQRDVELLRLRDRHVVVVLAVDEHHRRLHARYVPDRAPRPQRV